MSFNLDQINCWLFGVCIVLFVILLLSIKGGICEPMKTGRLIYGNTPVKLGTFGDIDFISANKKNIVEIPNSQTAMRHLFDNNEYKKYNVNITDLGGTYDDGISNMILSKSGINVV